MKAAKNRSCCDGTEELDRSMEWCIFVQCAMNSAFIIVGGELDEDPTQVCLPEYDQVVDALRPDCADQSFCKAVLPRRTGRDWPVANAHGAQAAGYNSTINRVTVADHIAWGLVPGKGFGNLLRYPVRGRSAVTLIQTSSRRASRTITRA